MRLEIEADRAALCHALRYEKGARVFGREVRAQAMPLSVAIASAFLL